MGSWYAPPLPAPLASPCVPLGTCRKLLCADAVRFCNLVLHLDNFFCLSECGDAVASAETYPDSTHDMVNGAAFCPEW